MHAPNLFHFATSELSQDAFICWLVSWAAPEYKGTDISLSNCAIDFLKEIFKARHLDFPENITLLTVERQYQNIDIVCRINNKFVLLLEDKINTKEHSNQLEKYLDIIVNEGTLLENILPVYFKMGEQFNFDVIRKAGFISF